MSRQGRLAARFALLLAGCFTFAILLRRSEPAGPEAAEPCFLTRAEAYQYAVARLCAAERLDAAGDPYSSTLSRSYTTVDGKQTHYFLVDDPARELDLAEGFAVHGFFREAVLPAGRLPPRCSVGSAVVYFTWSSAKEDRRFATPGIVVRWSTTKR